MLRVPWSVFALMQRLLDEMTTDQAVLAKPASTSSSVPAPCACGGGITVTKVLHRLRPNLVPLVGPVACTFYGTATTNLFETISRLAVTRGTRAADV
jgi:hypothetical protein